jgi:hypothetical protein
MLLLVPPASATSERQPPRRAIQPTDSSEKTTARSTLCAANRLPVVARPALWRMFNNKGTSAELSNRLLIAASISVRRVDRTRKTDFKAVA